MLRHVAKRQKLEQPVDQEDSGSSSDSEAAEEGEEEEFAGFGDEAEGLEDSASDVSNDGDEQDPLEKPIFEEAPGRLRCVICPLKVLKSDGDAITHTQSQAHHRRKRRAEDFLKTEEAKPFIENDDFPGIVSLLDQREKQRPEDREPKKKKPRVRPGKRQRAEIREQKIAEAAAKANGTNGMTNGADHASDSSSS